MSNKPTICEDCEHRIARTVYDMDFSRCRKSRLSYITHNAKDEFFYCCVVNRSGKCALFEPKVPLWRRIVAWVKGGTA